MEKKNLKFPIDDTHRVVISKEAKKWSLQKKDVHNEWHTFLKGRVEDDDPQLMHLKEALTIPVPDEALRMSICMSRAQDRVQA